MRVGVDVGGLAGFGVGVEDEIDAGVFLLKELDLNNDLKGVCLP